MQRTRAIPVAQGLNTNNNAMENYFKENYAHTAFIVIFLCESTAIPDLLL
jgi:hypothetical protein